MACSAVRLSFDGYSFLVLLRKDLSPSKESPAEPIAMNEMSTFVRVGLWIWVRDHFQICGLVN